MLRNLHDLFFLRRSVSPQTQVHCSWEARSGGAATAPAGCPYAVTPFLNIGKLESISTRRDRGSTPFTTPVLEPRSRSLSPLVNATDGAGLARAAPEFVRSLLGLAKGPSHQIFGRRARKTWPCCRRATARLNKK